MEEARKMKKKIKDFTIGEVIKICRNHYCAECPFFKEAGRFTVCSANPKVLNGLFLGASILDEEIEIPDEPVGNTDQLEEEE